MSSRKREVKEITKCLSQMDDIWQPRKKRIDVERISSLYSFLKKKKEKHGLNLNDLSVEKIPYNTSLLHFLLYYTSYPKYPFVVVKDGNIIFFALSGKHYNNLHVSLPVTSTPYSALDQLNQTLSHPSFINLLKKCQVEQILLRDIDDDFVNLLRENKYSFNLKSLRELNYSVYNLENTLDLSGNEFKNLRWHLNRFKKDDHKVEIVPLDDTTKPVVHLIGEWRKKSIEERDFSFVDVRSDKLAARFFGRLEEFNYEDEEIIGPEHVISRVLKVDGNIASFNLGFPLGVFKKQKVFAHAVGISDLSIPHLAEYAQYDFWKQIRKAGYRFVNDGPTWKDSLETYKDKFRPIEKKRFYWANLKASV
ncbi:MAG: phosphatidylglycerol lysyltransferase domain-containing protein [Candidatus Thermoplasmatota archaeon]